MRSKNDPVTIVDTGGDARQSFLLHEGIRPFSPRVELEPTPCSSLDNDQTLKITSSPKHVNEFGYSGPRFQGTTRAFNVRNAASYQGHIMLSGLLPFPMNETGEIYPQVIQDAISFIAHTNTQNVLDFWQEVIAKLTQRATELLPELDRKRRSILPQDKATRAGLHLTMLRSLLREDGMGGGRRIDQFTGGFPMIGKMAEHGVYKEGPPHMKPISREKLFHTAELR